MQQIPPDLGAVREEVDEEIRLEKLEREEGRRARERGVGVRGDLYT